MNHFTTQELRERVEALRQQLGRAEDELRRRENEEWRAWMLERGAALSQKLAAAIRKG